MWYERTVRKRPVCETHGNIRDIGARLGQCPHQAMEHSRCETYVSPAYMGVFSKRYCEDAGVVAGRWLGTFNRMSTSGGNLPGCNLGRSPGSESYIQVPPGTSRRSNTLMSK